MKKYFVAALAAIAALLTLSSCEDKSLKFYDLEIKVDESGFDSEVPVPDAYQVTFTNTNTGEVLGFTTVNKKISVLQIPEGVYDVVATARLSLYNYLGTVKGAVINSNESLTSIPVVATKSSSLVIKEVFYSCSRTPANATYLKDNYFEIYNNGPDPVFVDGLCIGTSSNYSSASINFADAEGNLVNADGTHTGIKADDYLCMNSVVWQVPGNGSTYLLNPGESFVIASYATDHTAEDKNPNSIDLSGADFETSRKVRWTIWMFRTSTSSFLTTRPSPTSTCLPPSPPDSSSSHSARALMNFLSSATTTLRRKPSPENTLQSLARTSSTVSTG